MTVLARKGYEGATIVDISEASNVSRGVLHYYFKDKEDLVAKTLSNVSSQLVESTLIGLEGETPEDIATSVAKALKNNFIMYPDFYRFLFEITCSSRRSIMIREELTKCQDKVLAAIKTWVSKANEAGNIQIPAEEVQSVSEMLLFVCDGLALNVVDRPERLVDNHIWDQFSKAVSGILKQKS